MQPNPRARIVRVIHREPLSPSHTAAHISDTLEEFTLEEESNSGHFTINDVYCTFLLFNKESFYVDALLPAGSKTVSIHHKDCFSGPAKEEECNVCFSFPNKLTLSSLAAPYFILFSMI